MTDRELLQAAARAAGIVVNIKAQADRDAMGCGHVGLWCNVSTSWNPLTDDADAFRLAVRLGLSITPYPVYSSPKHSVIVSQRRHLDTMRTANPTDSAEVFGNDSCAATRRAIVRAAAALDAGRMDGEKAP